MNAIRLSIVVLLALTAGPALPAQEKKPELRWGTDPTGGAPYVYQNAAGEYTGFEWDFAKYLADKLGRTPVMRPGDWDKLPQRLDQPRDSDTGIDIVLNGYEKREDLEKQYAATTAYYVYRLQLLTNRNNTTIKDWNDLTLPVDGRLQSVGVLGGSAAHEYLKNRFEGRIDLAINPDVATVMGLVRDRRLDATVQDSPAATYFLKDMPELKQAGAGVQPGFYVIYLRKNDKELLDKIDAATKEGMKDGTLRRIYKKYGLWNDDQEWLCYTQTGDWPTGEDGEIKSDDGEKVNPWPRMLRELLRAAGMTIFLSVTSFPLAIVIGLLVALGRVYGPRWLSIPLGVYVEVLRGTPLLLQLYFVFYLLPSLFAWFSGEVFQLPFTAFTPLQAGILGLAINYSAYESENYRAGLLAVPRGQLEAALALGMTPTTAVRRVIVPQAFRIVIPPVTNDFIALFKDTSVCSVILITELTRKYNELYNFNRNYIVELAFVTAGLYLLMSYPLALLARLLEHRLNAAKGGRA